MKKTLIVKKQTSYFFFNSMFINFNNIKMDKILINNNQTYQIKFRFIKSDFQVKSLKRKKLYIH